MRREPRLRGSTTSCPPCYSTHALAVIDRLRADGREVVLFDLSDFPVRAAVSIDYGDDIAPGLEYRMDGAEALDLATTTAVWWRRPQAPDVTPISGWQVAQFAAGEWSQAIAGLWQLLDRARWMNDPAKDDIASRKAYQLRIARECGLRTPRTLMTSDPDRARAFVDRIGNERTIFKTFSCTHDVWRETRLLRPADLQVIESVRYAR